MNKRKKIIFFIIILTIPPILIISSGFLDKVNYFISSSYKLIFFTPIFYRMYFQKKKLLESFIEGFNWRNFKKYFLSFLSIGLGLSVIYFLGFLFLSRFIDFNQVLSKIKQFASIDAKNIVYVGIYMIIINSLIEEFFWRGFVFKEINKISNHWSVYLLTAFAFSIYHVAIIYDWISFSLLLVAVFGLTGYSIVKNIVFRMYKDLYGCWLIHAMVDTVQILIAFRIFGLL